MRKANIFLFLLIAWGVLFWYHYVYNIKQVGTQTTEQNTIIVPEPTASPNSSETSTYLFKPNTHGLLLNKDKETVISDILSEGGSAQILQITGLKSSGEQEELNFDIGIARAKELKNLLLNDLSEERIELFSDTISNFSLTEEGLFAGVKYEWVDNFVQSEPQSESTNYFLINHETKRVKTENFETTINEVAQRLIDTGGKVIIIGHSDNSGDKELNFTIGLRNAKDIRDVLKEKGVDVSQIETTSRGEEYPIADNETEEGRIENRRIEIRIED